MTEPCSNIETKTITFVKKTKTQILRTLDEIFRQPPGEVGPHPDNDELAAYAGDPKRLNAETVARLDHHLERCGECAEIVERLIEAQTAPGALPFPVYVPDLEAVRAERARRDIPAIDVSQPLALAASEKAPIAEIVCTDHLLPEFEGEATGDVCLAGAERAFKEAIKINKELANARPDVPDFQGGLSVSWMQLGEVHKAQQDWDGAEAAFNEAMEINKKLAEAHPDLADFQLDLSASLERLGGVRQARQDLDGAEAAFKKAMTIRKHLAEAHPDVSDFLCGLARLWNELGDVHQERQNWDQAEAAYKEAMEIRKKFAEAHRDEPDFQFGLSASWVKFALAAERRCDHAAAENAWRGALRISEAMALAQHEVPLVHMIALLQAMGSTLFLRKRHRAVEAAAVARAGMEQGERLAALLRKLGEELTEQQKEIISELSALAVLDDAADT